MNITVILFSIFMPPFIMFFFSLFHKQNTKTNKKMSDKKFTVMIPNVVIIIGVMCEITSIGVLLGFTFFSKELPHIIFYIFFGLFLWLGMYLIIKTLFFKVIVVDKKITVLSFIKKSYTFTFEEITQVTRQIKKNQLKSERLIIKVSSGKKLIVESSEISYNRFMKRIKEEVCSNRLLGFEEKTGDG